MKFWLEKRDFAKIKKLLAFVVVYQLAFNNLSCFILINHTNSNENKTGLYHITVQKKSTERL
jgi:hypothetical protein